MVEWFDRGCQDEEEEEEEEEDFDDPNAVEGESATQRSRRLRREKEAKEAGRSQRKQEVVEKKEEEDLVFIADADDKKEAFWPEVIKALASAETVQQTQKEVSVCAVCALAVTGACAERSGLLCCRCVSR